MYLVIVSPGLNVWTSANAFCKSIITIPVNKPFHVCNVVWPNRWIRRSISWVTAPIEKWNIKSFDVSKQRVHYLCGSEVFMHHRTFVFIYGNMKFFLLLCKLQICLNPNSKWLTRVAVSCLHDLLIVIVVSAWIWPTYYLLVVK